MYSYFISATETDIAQMNDLDDVAHHIEQTEPMVGGKISFQEIVSLSKVFQTSSIKPIGHKIKEEGTFYLFDPELKERLAKAESEELMNLSVLWDEDFWTETEINRMDLAGFLLELSLLCKQAIESKKNVYLLESYED
jgi:hypothetical protein